MSTVLRADGLVATRGGRAVLDGVSIQVERGERVAVVGPSGAGKSTLLALLAGLEPPERGRVRIDDVDIARLPVAELRRDVGIVLQGYGLVSLLTAEENVELVLQASGNDPDDTVAAARAALEAVGLDGRGDHLVEALSGGEQQRVAIARALVMRPRVLLADEPTAELDAATRERVLDLLLDAADEGVAVVIATHDPAVAARCDRQLRVHGGRLEADVSTW